MMSGNGYAKAKILSKRLKRSLEATKPALSVTREALALHIRTHRPEASICQLRQNENAELSLTNLSKPGKVSKDLSGR
jgi:hypothetical protein